MARNRAHSRISDELPPEIRREVDRLLVEGNATYDEIGEFLAGKGFDVSHSAIGRYGKQFFSQYQQLKIIEDQSRTMVSEAGGDVPMLEEAASKMFVKEVIVAIRDGKFDVVELPRLLSDFAKLQASSALRERLKMEFKKRVEKAAKNVEKKLTGAIDAETLRKIREEIYGIVT